MHDHCGRCPFARHLGSDASLVTQRVFESLAIVENGHVVLTIILLRGFGATDYLCGNAKGFAFSDDAGCGVRLTVDFHAVAHVINAEHLFGAGTAGCLNGFENRWDR